MYGHTFRMADAAAEGVREAGGEPILKQVAELVPKEFWNETVRRLRQAPNEDR
jgi:multimeric flavodoxin WrbA